MGSEMCIRDRLGVFGFLILAIADWSLAFFGGWGFLIWPPMGAAFFGGLSYAVFSEKPYWRGMMRVYVNERASVIQEKLVTAQMEFSVPKILFAHRRGEWQYDSGRPFMWLQLPAGARFQVTDPDDWDNPAGSLYPKPYASPNGEAIRRVRYPWTETLDFLFLPRDEHRSLDDAVYTQKTYNRMVDDAARVFSDVDANVSMEDRNTLQEIMPYVLMGGICIAAILAFIILVG